MNAANAKRLSPIIGSFISYGALVLVVILAITAILMLVRTITCSNAPANAFEHFQSDSESPTIQSRIAIIERLKGELLSAVEELATASDETCAISKELEEIYVSNASTPNTQSDLPPEIQTRLAEARKKRATAGYQQKKARFGATLECFTTEGDAEIAVLETQVRELEELIDSTEVRMADVLGTKINTMLKFNYRIIEEAIIQYEAAKKKKNEEGFATEGMEVIAKADVLIGKATAFLDAVKKLKDDVKTQRAAANELNKKFSSFESGDYNASDAAGLI
jgi:hypothetical protein